MENLIVLMNSNPDPRVLKRALAVKMSLQTYSVAQIATVLQVSLSFVSIPLDKVAVPHQSGKGGTPVAADHFKDDSGYLGKGSGIWAKA